MNFYDNKNGAMENSYCLSVDDNIWFLADINNNKDTYKSIFENPYLAFYKGLNDTYGTCVHLNLFYETDHFGGFNLSQMTDKFKSEWKANAGWLKLTFHAKAEFPDDPYHASKYDEVATDCDKIDGEIRRFAGEEVMAKSTTVHWGSGTRETVKALKDRGYNNLLAYMNVEPPHVSYYLSPEQIKEGVKNAFFRDEDIGMNFTQIDLVLNCFTPEEIVSILEERKARGKWFYDVMIHEQYFYPFYERYLPDFEERVLAAINWFYSNGYTPKNLDEVLK